MASSALLIAVALAACDEQPPPDTQRTLSQAVTSAPVAIDEQEPSTHECPGPWTDCPEADWVRHVVRRADYRLVGGTGSALIAKGHGYSFYIWAIPLGSPPEEIAREKGWKLLGRVDGSHVWGSKDWRWWVAQRHIFWVSAGPHALSKSPAPTENELGPLIRASKALRF